MKSLYIIFTLAMLGLGVNIGKAQTLSIGNDVLQWDVDQLYDSAANSTASDFTSQFITYGNSKIVWVQKNNYTTEFTIRSADGNWNDPALDGSKDYYVKYDTRRGRIRITKNGNVIQIKMFFIESNKNTMPYVFHVKTVSKQL
jgi:hypothetical protein